MGELIVYQALQLLFVVSRRMSVHNFKHLLLWNHRGQLNLNFIWRLLRMQERKFAQMVLVTWSRWPPCPYMVKTLKKSSPEPEGWWPWDLVCSIGVVGMAVAAYLKVVRRRKSSSAEGAKGWEHERGIIPPIFFFFWGGGVEGIPWENCWILSASICVFNGLFMCLGPDFSRFGHKDISCRVRNRMLDKIIIVFRQSNVFFYSACFFDIISSMSPQVLPKYFKHWSLVVLQRVMFSKRYVYT